MIGKIISHYKIIEKLGEGGMGVVYKAEDTKLKRTVALKFLPPELTRDEKAKKRFIHEAQAASALDHPNVCTIYEIDETNDGQTFIAMACYEGEILKDKIQRGPLKVEEAIDIATQIAHGLEKAHNKGIVHRDIKLANILKTEDEVVKIIDFGLAKLAGRTKLTKTGTTLGTATYMSPEQTRGEKVDHRSDIWSLGVVLYEMITGQLPFKGDYEQAVVYSIVNEEPEPLTGLRTGVPMELERIASKALKKNIDERYQNVGDMLVDLKGLKKDLESDVKTQPAEIVENAERKNWFKLVFMPVGAALILFLAFFMLKSFISEEVLGSAPEPIAVLPFENLTGNSSFDIYQKSIANLLIAKLEQSKYLRVTTWERMGDLLKQTGNNNIKIVDIDKETSFELCRMDGVDAAVTGSFFKMGDRFTIEVKVLDVASKDILVSETSDGEGENSIFKQIDRLARVISRGMGLSERKIVETRKPIEEGTTASMDAYNYFLRGRDEYEKNYNDDARRFLEKAIERDSTFAVAHLYLARVYDNLRYVKKEEGAYEKAKAFSEKATDKERLYIEADYAGAIEDDPEKRYRILKQMAKKYPKEKRVHYSLGSYYRYKIMYKEAIIDFNKALELDPDYGPAINLLAYTYSEMGDHERAIEHFKRYASASPGDADPFDSMAELYFKLGKLDEAIGKYKEALEVKPDFGSEPRIAYIYALKENYAETIKWIDHFIAMSPSPGVEGQGFAWRALYYSLLGHFNQSLKDVRRAKELTKLAGNEYGAAVMAMIKGWIYFDRGEYELCRKCFEEYRDFVKDYRYLYDYIGSIWMLGRVDVREGRTDSAKSRMAEIEPLLLELSENDPYWETQPRLSRNFLRMEVMIAEGAFEDAIALDEKTVPSGIVGMGMKELLSYNIPFLQDILARAYYRNGELDKAIAEYERSITIDLNSNNRRLIHPKYHYLLAKLYEEKDWKGKAIEQYGKFLDIWKDADEDLPEPHDARSRLAKLKEER
ncbi:MAG: protein kinase [bacterium]